MSKKGSDGSWIGIIICLWFFWPLGLFLLYKKLSDDKKTAGSRRKIEWIGVVLAILGLYRISELFGNFDAGKFGEGLFFLIGGCAVAGAGIWQRMRDNLYRKYKAIIGNRDFIDIETVARAIPTGIHKACRDIQSMIDSGMLGETAYIDMGKRRLVLDGSVYETVESEFVPEDEPKAKEASHDSMADECEQKLRELRRLNDDIENDAVSADIDRIAMLTGSIFAAVRENPEKREKIHTFMNYYLPTTIKLLSAYAHLEDQPMSVPNVAQSRQDIEKTIGRLVECFEQLVNQLYKSDFVDITSDIQVLEAMMAKDGMGGKYSFKK